MKTIFVVYANPGNYALLSDTEKRSTKRYTFNTEADVEEGDGLMADEYNKPLTVVEVLDKHYSYVNINTGELFQERQVSTLCYPIRTLEERKPSSKDIIYFDKMPK